MFVLEGPDDVEDLLVADKSAEAVFELFGVGARSTKDGAALGNPDEGGFEFLQDAPEVVDYFFDLRGEPGQDFPEGVVELLDNASVDLPLVPRDFLVFSQFFLYSFEQFLGGLVLRRGRQPVPLLVQTIHLN